MKRIKINWFVVLFGLIAFLGIYKFFEYKLISDLAFRHSASLVEELTFEAENDKTEQERTNVVLLAFGIEAEPIDKNSKEKNKTIEEIFDDAISAIKIEKEKSNQYLDILENNNKEFIKLKKFSKLIVGKRGNFVKEFISNQSEYYQETKKYVMDMNTDSDMVMSLITIKKDWNNIDNFLLKTSNLNKNYSKYFNVISSLDKYTDQNFKFLNEDKIKIRSPYAFEMLSRNKEYFSVYYQIIKDFVEGDDESGTYKLSKLNNILANFNFDYERIFGENSESNLEHSKYNAKIILRQIQLITNFKTNNLGKYPLVKEVGGWKDQLLLCDSYQYRVGIYYGITNKLVKSTNHKDLLNEFNLAGVQVVNEDQFFDETNLLISESDKLLTFTCIDKDTGSKYSIAYRKD